MADHMEMKEEKAKGALPGIGDLKAYSQQSLSAIVQAVKEAGSLPIPGEDHDFYYSFPDFREFRTAQGDRILNNIGNLLRHWRVHCQWPSDCHGIDPESDELVESLVEANDILLEGVDTSLDEAAGLKKNKTNQTVAGAAGQQGTPIVSSWNRAKKQTADKRENSFRFLMAKNIQRPQLRFKDAIDNSNTPFIPIIRCKPNALKPLLTSPQSVSSQPKDSQVPSAIADFVHQERMRAESEMVVNSTSATHPYQYELENFEPDKCQLKPCKEQLYEPLDMSPFTFVETVEQLKELSDQLLGVTEFAVDLEHHSYRSFQGFCCLMQISTRSHDYLVDTLELRSELHILNQSFTNPKILKVFHGADMDICWLQRDFGLYVVNMFDTGQATRVLNYGKYSLAFLLKKFCDVTANKQYQLADWRIRPLPAEMVKYAREDTHYLLYICDRLHNELLTSGNSNNNLLLSVYSRSKSICLKCYEKPLFTSESYQKVLEKYKRAFSPEQVCAFRLLFAWRDEIARQEDESYGFVLPNHMMFQIAETMPREPQGILACCNPVPTLVKQYVHEMHLLIVQAKEMALTASKNLSFSCQATSGKSRRQSILESPSKPESVITDEGLKHKPLVVNGDSSGSSSPPSSFGQVTVSGPPVVRTKPGITLFELSDDEQLTDGQRKAEKIKASFENPFRKFLPVRSQSETTEGKTTVDEPQSQEQIDKITKQWRQAASEVQMNPPSPTDKKRKLSTNSDPEDAAPLRQQTPRKEKKKKRKLNSTSNPSPAAVRNEKDDGESASCETHNSPQFVPFDYSTADYSSFSGGTTQTEAQDKRIVFDPYNSKGDKAKSPRSKVHMKSGQRSTTFSSNKSSTKQKLPRR